MRRTFRVLGTVLIGAGILTLAWVLVVWRWQDPFTALYTTYQQHRLASAYDERFATFGRLPHTDGVAQEERAIRLEAARYRKGLAEGEALGRLKVPRLGLDSIVVVGTETSSLKKGPGWFTGTSLPGQGELIYIAGHRTTYLAPFAHIDRLRPGDRASLAVPYGTFLYEVTRHVIVPAGDVSRLRSHHREVLALQACHPRFFATHRYIAYARLVRVEPRGGKAFAVGLRAARAARAA